MKTNSFIYDFYSLKDVSLSEWSDSFFWPVARESTQNILVDLVGENTRIINVLGDTFEGDCLTIFNQTWNPYVRMANYLLVLKQLQEANYNLCYSDKSAVMAYLLDNGKFPVPREDLRLLLRDRKHIRVAKNALLSIRYNNSRGNRQVWNHFNRSHLTYSMPDENVLGIPSTQQEKNWLRITTPEEWLSNWDKVNVDQQSLKMIRNIARSYHDFAIGYMRDRLGLDVPRRISRDLEAYYSGYLEHIAYAYQCIRMNVSRQRPLKIFVGTGKTFTKALSLAVRKEGGKVRGHPHGYFICHSASHRPHVHEFATVDEFAVYTESMKHLFERNVAEFTPPRSNKVSFISQNNSVFSRFRDIYKLSPIANKVRTVMVLELQLWVDDIRYEIPETMVNYQFYYKLCNALTDNGYKVIFKKRPKSWGWQEIDFLKDNPDVRVVYGSLEDPEIMNMTDAIIFQYGLSSTLVPLMCSNKKLIYADADWEAWYPDVYELMQKRCSVLKCWHDETNQQQFNTNDLLDILSEEPQKPNMEFFEKYLKLNP